MTEPTEQTQADAAEVEKAIIDNDGHLTEGELPEDDDLDSDDDDLDENDDDAGLDDDLDGDENSDD